ncbi:MJ0042-type zinc finger domain-containing protein [Bremerella sp. T1]|uniref:MJ0042-type zinc finger domain-containing protein n=1 Tax=Bremerella sp. TYQ1 TaxID=3119568 RepID=UPI001CCB6339|nr:MJ0042-type zinc finger domain-containing protein [Bremerella volcania]UBM37164.1 hypothetical protein LA756_04575 [Bremerella volcania]
MTTIAKCTHCESTFKVKDHLVGKAVRCPRCGDAFRVQAQAGIATTPRKHARAASTTTPAVTTEAEPLAVSAPVEEDFYHNADDDPNAKYEGNVATARLRKKKRHVTFLISCGAIAALVLIGGTVAALQYVYDKAEMPLELAEPQSFDVEKLSGNWRPYGDTKLGYALSLPGEPQITQSPNDEDIRVVFRDPQFGNMIFEMQSDANPEWNDYFASIDSDEILRGVPAANFMKRSSSSIHWVGSTAVHQYVLTSKDTRLTKNVAVVQKFFADGKTVTVIWAGKRSQLRSTEVSYFFASVEVMGKRYLTR